MHAKLISKKLLDALVCPVCKSKLKYTKDKKNLECVQCRVEYPIQNGTPLLLPPGMF